MNRLFVAIDFLRNGLGNCLVGSLETTLIRVSICVGVVESSSPETNNNNDGRPALSSLFSIEDTSEQDYKPKMFLGMRRRSPKKGKTRFASTSPWESMDWWSTLISVAARENVIV